MAFVARKPFTFKGTKYRPGDVVKGFPEDFFRSEGFIRTGYIVEDPNLVVPEETRRGRKPKAVVEEVAPVVEEPVIVEEEAVEVLPEVAEEVAE
jgi:hypothetical protein